MVPNPDVFAPTLGLSYNLLAIAEEEDRLTVVVGGANRYFRIGLIVGILAILANFLLELALLRQLSVFNTELGLWVFISQFLIAAALLLILVVVGSFACRTVHRSSGTRKPWIVYYILLGLAIFGAFTSGLNNGLSLDVKYSTYLGEGRNRLPQPPIPRWCSHLDSSRPYSSLHAQRPTHLLRCGGRWQEAPLHAQQTLGPLTTIPDRQSWRCLSTKEIR